MTLEELEIRLGSEKWGLSDHEQKVDLGLEEDVFIHTLKDMADTSWGRDTLDYEIIEKWLDNFTGNLYCKEYERLLALILAVHMVYYNEYDICHLAKLAYRKLLHEIMEQNSVALETAAESMVFLPLGTISESGPFLSYYFRKENCLPTEFFVSSLEPVLQMNRLKNIVLLDDVSISGGQVEWYLKKMKRKSTFFEKVLAEKNLYALFLMATQTAEKRLKEFNVKLCTPIMMDRRSRCFDEESSIYRMFDRNIRDMIRIQSKTLCEYYGCRLLVKQYKRNGEFQRLLDEGKTDIDIIEKVRKDALGYDDAQMLIAFEYNTPNNTLPIIWVDDQEWSPLFKRYDKLYTRQAVGGIKSENVYI